MYWYRSGRRVVLGVGAEPRRVHLVGHRDHVVVGDVAVVAEREHAESLDRLGALGDHQVAGERVDVVEAGVGAVGQDVGPRAAARASTTGVTSEREVLGAVGVREHVEPVAGRAGVVLDVVLVALSRAARRPRAARSASSASTSHTSLVTFDAEEITRKRPLRVRPTPT